MSNFAPQPVLTRHYFEIVQNGGVWVAKEKEGLIGGVFRTQKDALRSARPRRRGDRVSGGLVLASPRIRSGSPPNERLAGIQISNAPLAPDAVSVIMPDSIILARVKNGDSSWPT
jgi:hypothetical protein